MPSARYGKDPSERVYDTPAWAAYREARRERERLEMLPLYHSTWDADYPVRDTGAVARAGILEARLHREAVGS